MDNKTASHVKTTDIGSNKVESSSVKWSALTRMFHWISFILLILTWLMIALYENTEGNTYLNLHRAFGVSLLLWTVARLINRLFVKSPVPILIPMWQKAIAHLTHFVLYVLLLAMPIAGVLMTWYAGRSIDMFGLFALPSMVETDRALSRYFNDLHIDIIWPAILIFTAIHIVGALYHQFIKKDNLISRMR